jgi:RNA polymerase sigma-70 factor (ECF subfamily)
MTNRKDISHLYLKLRSSLARAVVGIVPPKEVEDIVQEAYVRVCQIDKKGGIRTPKSYLFKTVRNLALDYVKRSESRLSDSMDTDIEFESRENVALADSTFEQVASNEEFALLCEAVRLLPVQARRAFVLKKVYGYSQGEIAREMHLSENTVEKHIALGIKRCAYFMQQYHSTDCIAERENHSEVANHEATSVRKPRA